MNLTTVVLTCDSYSKYLNNFVKLYDKYFKFPNRKIIVTENLKQEYTDYECVLYGNIPWGKRFQNVLDIIDTDYVFVLFEDYYLSQTLDQNMVTTLLNFAESNNVDKLTLHTGAAPANIPMIFENNKTIDFCNLKFKKLSNTSNWLASTQPSFWKKSHLQFILEENYTPWDFELIGAKKIFGKQNTIYYLDIQNEIYFNLLRRGRQLLANGWEDFLKKENLTLPQ